MQFSDNTMHNVQNTIMKKSTN